MLRYAIDLNKYKDRDPRPGKDNYHEEYQYLKFAKRFNGTWHPWKRVEMVLFRLRLVQQCISLSRMVRFLFLLLKKLLGKLVLKSYYGLLEEILQIND